MGYVWVCRCGVDGEYEKYFLDNNVVGFHLGNFFTYTPCPDYNPLKRRLSNYDIEDDKLRAVASRIFAIPNKMVAGDYVLVPSKIDHSTIYVGMIDSGCKFDPTGILTFSRKVLWKGMVYRNQIDKQTSRSIGAVNAVFQVHPQQEFLLLLESICQYS